MSGSHPREHTPNNLTAWSVIQSALPGREAVGAIHVYDFDDTLFVPPRPNPKLWNEPTLGNLASPTWLSNGGWWQDSRILAAVGHRLDDGKGSSWDGWWNEHVVDLVRLSMQQTNALTVLLTGRSAKAFWSLIPRIVNSKQLAFDMIVLKPEIMPNGIRPHNVIGYKCLFLEDLLNTYDKTKELRIYDDVERHVRAFDKFCQNYIQTTYSRRAPLNHEVFRVAEAPRSLDPTVELSQVQRMVDEHNAFQRAQGRANCPPLRIKKTVFCTGYLLNAASTTSLLNSLEVPAMVGKGNGVMLLASNVLITPGPASKSILSRTGPLGTKVEFKVVGVGNHDNRVWAARVKPVDETVQIYTDDPEPTVVLAVRRGCKPIEAQHIDKSSWQHPPRPITFTATVGEQLLLRIEEDSHEGEFAALFPKWKSSGT